MKKVYIVCKDGKRSHEDACLEYARKHDMSVFCSSFPNTEAQKKSVIETVISEAGNGNIDTMLIYDPSIISRFSEQFIQWLIALDDAGVTVELTDGTTLKPDCQCRRIFGIFAEFARIEKELSESRCEE